MIFIEWGPLASWENYFRAAQNALNVGDYTGEFLANLMQASGLKHEVSSWEGKISTDFSTWEVMWNVSLTC